MIIVITGKQDAGKTTVARLLWHRGLRWVNADKIGHKLLSRQDLKKSIIKAFGKEILLHNRISRPRLARIAFSSAKNVRVLNAITHPSLIKEIQKQAKGDCVIEAALFHELNLDKIADVIIEVRGSHSGPRSKFQKNIKGANFIIYNNGSRKELKAAVDEIWEKSRFTLDHSIH